MVDDLMRDPAVILQDVVVFGAGGTGDAFRDGLFPPTEHQPGHIQQPAGLIEALKGRGGGEVPGFLGVARPGYRSVSRRGVWGSRAVWIGIQLE